jgi:hypothetical protein
MRFAMSVAVALVMLSGSFSVARSQGTWSTAQLSSARASLAAVSAGNLVLFAGGYKSTGSAFSCRNGGCRWIVGFAWGYYGFVCHATTCFCHLSALQARLPMPLICTTVLQGSGRRLCSARRALNSL